MKFVLLGLLVTLPLAAQTTNPPPAPADDAGAADEPVVIAPPLSNAAPAATASTLDVPPAAPALSPDPFSEPLISQIVVRYQKAWAGDKKETKALTADLERWTKDEPSNYLLLAYLGSAYALDSRDAWIGPGKLSYLKKGDKALDDAVKDDPSNPAIRLLRAMNYYELPAMFGKHRAAHEDFQYLIGQLKGVMPMPYALNPDTRQAIYYYAGLSDIQFNQPAEARDAWTTGLAIAPASKLGVKIQAELNKLK